MPGDYSEELVELVRSVGSRSCGLSLHPDTARKILDALSSSGRLVPPGSEVREEWGAQWLTGEAVFEYDDREQAELYAREAAAFPGQVMHRTHITTPWSPSVPDTEEGS